MLTKRERSRRVYNRIERRYLGKQRTRWDEWFYWLRELFTGKCPVVDEWEKQQAEEQRKRELTQRRRGEIRR